MKNPNGFGTVYRLPGKRRRPFIARVTIAHDRDNSKPSYYTLGYFEDRPAGIAALVKYHGHGIGPRRDMKLGAIFEEWKKTKYPKISKSTQDNYEAVWRHLSTLEGKRMADIKKSHLQAIFDGLDQSYSTISKTKALVTMLWDHALADDIVDRNYGKLVDIKKSTIKEKAIFNDFEIDKLNKLAKAGDEKAMTIMILIYSGLRIGELLILTKFDVDLKKKIITGGIKTDAGKNRVVPIHPKILPYIKHWRKKKTDFLITKDGEKMTDDVYRVAWWYPTLEKAGVSKLTPHSTRHTCATLLSRAGADPLAIQRILGHTKYSTSADLYTRTDLVMLKDAIGKI